MGTPAVLWLAVAPALARGPSAQPRRSADVVVVGSGIGGLSCAAMLSRYGYRVTVCEAHDRVGGAAHGFSRRVAGIGTFHFDSGPSLFSGCSAPSANPLRQVLDAVGASCEWRTYSTFDMHIPEGKFVVTAGDPLALEHEFLRVGGPAAAADWRRLQLASVPLGNLIGAVPPIALRGDLGAAVTAGPYATRVNPLDALRALTSTPPTGSFARVLEEARVPQTSLVWRFFDFLAFALSGLPVEKTSAAAVGFMLRELFADGAVMDYPEGGSQAVANALSGAIEARGGQVLTNAKVAHVHVTDNVATGVTLASGETIDASLAVVSNAPARVTSSLLPAELVARTDFGGTPLDLSTPATPSFMHLHAAVRGDGLEGVGVHHIDVRSWDEPIDAKDNCVFVAMTSAVDATTAPAGYHAVHAYLPATEPYADWEGLEPRSDEYARRKEERAGALWRGFEKVVPDARARCVFSSIGSPLTHARYLSSPSYGPAWVNGKAPAWATPVRSLFCVGASTFPGIGVPAVAGSGLGLANTMAPVAGHTALLDAMRREGCLR